MRRFFPKSLLGQMLLSVALALLVAQTISAVLQYRSAEQRREMIAANGLAFQLVTEPRFDFRRPNAGNAGKNTRGRWQRLQVERTAEQPVHAGETRDPAREEMLRSILADQGVDPAQLVVVTRAVADDEYVMNQLRQRERADWATLIHSRLVVVARNAAGFTITLRFVDCHCNQTSCTTSSASAAFPSTR